MERLLCFVSARNLGDAVFHAEFLKALVAHGFASRVVAWTFPAARPLSGIQNCDVVVSDFPMGASQRSFLGGGFVGFFRAARQIRRMRPSFAVELVGDYRERFAAKLTGAPRRLAPQWERGHPFREHNRIGAPRPGPLRVPRASRNLYVAYGEMLRTLIGVVPPAFRATPSIRADNAPMVVAIHPLASARCKLWPEAHWIAFIVALRRRYPKCEIVLFGAPSDEPTLQRLADTAGRGIEVACGPLEAFRERLSRQVTVLVGLDSVSVHLANSVGLPSVVLVGPNDPVLFTPPRAVAVARQSDCPVQPCAGKPTCIGRSYEYACMKAIAPDDALNAVSVVLHRPDHLTPMVSAQPVPERLPTV